MLVLISPAKTLDFETPWGAPRHTQPGMLKEARELVALARRLSEKAIQKLMGISPKLARLNVERFKRFSTPFTAKNARPALLAYKGDVYRGIAVDTFTDKEWGYAQDTLRILSGLYGCVRPLDLIQPYRLEMGISLENKRGKDLYAFWGTRLTEALNAELASRGKPVVVNLASNEYFKAIQPDRLKARLITPVFKQFRDGRPRLVSILAKRARGLMSNYIIKRRLSDPEAMKEFDAEGYAFHTGLSEGDTWVFTREG